MSLLAWLQATLLLSGAGFFLVGTLGLLRLPDTFSRIHALTKADNLGLGLIIVGLLPSAPTLVVGLKLVLIWLLTLAASATAGHLVANAEYFHQQRRRGDQAPFAEDQADPVAGPEGDR